MTAPAAGTVAAILADATSVVTAASGWITTYVNAITGNPLIEMFVITTFVGLGVGLIRRLIRL